MIKATATSKLRLSLWDLSRLKFVPRWSIVPNVPPESVAAHTGMVALFALRLADAVVSVMRCEPTIEIDIERVLRYALTHDAAEVVTGDIPSPAKRILSIFDPSHITTGMEPTGTVNKYEAAIVKIADILDAVSQLMFTPGHENDPYIADVLSNLIKDTERLTHIFRESPAASLAIRGVIEEVTHQTHFNSFHGVPVRGQIYE